ncbi:IgGFc-binding protein [Sandaracinus amylolyticus]|uniref:IgGFc-binding protein n=1 Tax=Sandaracinus amylolyticus TaxID=927083 RepID=UPI001F361E2B|nr:IgGFc-binding protein [Sandaracinus amylolyticus]UJR84955.1 Hypothetical protein I5071_70340 [Sandaracinus amylolyticus]
MELEAVRHDAITGIESWGREHVGYAVGLEGTAAPGLVRIVAAFDGTDVDLEPPQRGIAGATLDAGESVELEVEGAFRLVANEPILVVQTLGATEISWVVAPVDRHRRDYTIHLPEGALDAHALVIVRPRATWTVIDEDASGLVRAARVGEWEICVARVRAGTHRAIGERAFALIAVGRAGIAPYATLA